MQIDVVGPSFLDSLYSPAIEILRAQGHEVRRFAEPETYLQAQSLPTADILVSIGGIRIGEEELDGAPRLRALISPVTGTEAFDQEAATRRNVLIANGQIEENYVSMAEAAVMLVLAALYDLNGTQRLLRQNLPRPEHVRARMLMKKTVGLIGFGQISQAVARRLSTWDCRMLAFIRHPRELPSYISSTPLDQLLGQSDVVVVLTGLDAETRGMLSMDKLRLMKPAVTFVNVARGGIASDDDLLALARERPQMRLALDVFAPEPLDAASPLRELPGTILTPHMVGHTVETHDRLPLVLEENIRRALNGDVPDYVRNRDVIEAWQDKWRTNAAKGD